MLKLPVYVIGFGDIYCEFFNAVAAIMGSSAYAQLLKLIILLSGIWTLVLASIKFKHSLNIRWVLTYVVLTSCFLLPRVTVIINDRTERANFKYYSIDNIPLGLGILAYLTSSIGTGLTELIESVFHTPDDLTYTKSGMLMGSKIIDASSHFQIVDADFQKNLQGFMQQCVFYDILLHKYSLENLMESPNIWSLISRNASPARAFLYNHKIVTCNEGVQYLCKDWQTAIYNSSNQYAHLLFINNQNAASQLISYLSSSYQYMANLSDDAAHILQQNMLIHAIQDGVDNWNAKLALNNFALTKAQEQKRTGYQLLFKLAVYWLPLSKAVMELILLGSFIIIILLAFFPFGTAVLKNYVMTFTWLQLWAPLFAFENFILTYYGKDFLSATLLKDNSHGLTLQTFSSLNQMNNDLGILAGFFASLTPVLAVGIFKGMMEVFTQASNYIGSSMQNFAFQGAGEAISGNLSLGNTQFSNHSASNNNNLHWDSNPKVGAGILNYQLNNGGTNSVSPDGEFILNSNGAVSNLPVTPHMAESMQLSFSNLADRAESFAARDVMSAQESYAAGLRKIYELGDYKSSMQNSGNNFSLNDSGNSSNSFREVHQLVDRFAKENNLNHADAVNALSATYFGQSINGSIGTSGLLGKFLNINGNAFAGHKNDCSHIDSHNKSALMNKAENFSRENNFAENIEHAIRVASEQNFRTGSEHGDRIAHNLASSFEEGNRYSKDAIQAYEKSASYREQASLVKNQSIGINTQASQEFAAWLLEQPSIKNHFGINSAQDIMTMMQNDTQLAHEYAADFIKQKELEYMNKFAAQHQSIPHNAEINKGKITKTAHHYDDIVKQHSLAHNIQNVNDKISNTVNDKLHDATQKTNQVLTEREKNIQQEVENKIKEKGIVVID